MPVQSDKTLFEDRWLRVVSRPYLHRHQPRSYTTVMRPDSVVILPVTPTGRTLLLSQFKVPVGVILWDFPAGLVEHGETPEDAARRELIEETGLHATDLVPLGQYHPAPGLTPQTTSVFSAEIADRSLAALVLPDGDDDIRGRRVCLLDDIPGMIRNGVLKNAFSLTAFLYWQMSAATPR